MSMVDVTKQAHTMPSDLYIPPDALEVVLEAFSGPLDLLLYLIKKQNIDILELSIVDITEQYLVYITLMKAIRIDRAADYLVMAAMLAQIKSAMLLPAKSNHDKDYVSEDPRHKLIQQLQAYHHVRNAALKINLLARAGRDFQVINMVCPAISRVAAPIPLDLNDLVNSYRRLNKHNSLTDEYNVLSEEITVQDKIHDLLQWSLQHRATTFSGVLCADEGREGVAVSLLALLELTKTNALDCEQADHNDPIHITVNQSAMVAPDYQACYAP
jgi:segregation and condensation protein A